MADRRPAGARLPRLRRGPQLIPTLAWDSHLSAQSARQRSVFESLTDAQWVAFSLVFLGLALICGMLLRRAVPWLAAVYIPPSVLAGFLLLLAGSPPSPTSPSSIGRRSGPPTHSSGSTRRSNAAPTSSASSPTRRPCSGSPAASLIEPHDEWQVAEPRYLSEGSMALTDAKPTAEITKEVATPALAAS
jgi:hypothetical protein